MARSTVALSAWGVELGGRPWGAVECLEQRQVKLPDSDQAACPDDDPAASGFRVEQRHVGRCEQLLGR